VRRNRSHRRKAGITGVCRRSSARARENSSVGPCLKFPPQKGAPTILIPEKHANTLKTGHLVPPTRKDPGNQPRARTESPRGQGTFAPGPQPRLPQQSFDPKKKNKTVKDCNVGQNAPWGGTLGSVPGLGPRVKVPISPSQQVPFPPQLTPSLNKTRRGETPLLNTHQRHRPGGEKEEPSAPFNALSVATCSWWSPPFRRLG